MANFSFAVLLVEENTPHRADKGEKQGISRQQQELIKRR
jgi:hypothetical protein